MALVIPTTKDDLEKLLGRLKKRSQKELQVTFKNLIGSEPGELDRQGLFDGIETKIKELMGSEKAPSQKTSPKSKASKKPREPRETIKTLVIQILIDKPDIAPDVMIKKVKEKFPDSKFSPSHVAWYKNKFKKGELK